MADRRDAISPFVNNGSRLDCICNIALRVFAKRLDASHCIKLLLKRFKLLVLIVRTIVGRLLQNRLNVRRESLYQFSGAEFMQLRRAGEIVFVNEVLFQRVLNLDCSQSVFRLFLPFGSDSGDERTVPQQFVTLFNESMHSLHAGHLFRVVEVQTFDESRATFEGEHFRNKAVLRIHVGGVLRHA